MNIKSLLLTIVTILIIAQSCTTEEINSDYNEITVTTTKGIYEDDTSIPQIVCHKPFYVVYQPGTSYSDRQNKAETIGRSIFGDDFYFEFGGCDNVDIWYIPAYIPITSSCEGGTIGDRLEQTLVVLDADDIDDEAEADDILTTGLSGPLVINGETSTQQEQTLRAYTCDEARALILALTLDRTVSTGQSTVNNNDDVIIGPIAGSPIE